MSGLVPYLLIQNRKRRRTAAKTKNQRLSRKFGFGLLTTFLILFGLTPLAAGLIYANLTRNLPAIENFEIYLNPKNGTLLTPTTIYDRNEETIIYQLQNSNFPRRFLTIDPNNEEFFSPFLVQYMVAEYEPFFWTSKGYSTNRLNQHTPETIAEILVDRLLLWQEKDSFNRYLRMKILAAQITNQYGRVQVLEWFLNSQNFGPATIGADSAARTYFGKPASQLTRAEAALLVSVSRTPALNPSDAPQAALQNLKQLLLKMKAADKISAEDYAKASTENVTFNIQKNENQTLANTFARLVVNSLYKTLGYERVELGGIQVVSTLDMKLQQELRCTLDVQLQRLQGVNLAVPECLPTQFLPPLNIHSQEFGNTQASAVVLNPQNGEILALVGDLSNQQENSLLVPHQAGSILTPLVAVNAFARGFTPASQVWDIPSPQAGGFETSQYQGPIRLRTALANNYIAPLEELMAQLGAQTIWQSARTFGLSSPISKNQTKSILEEGNSANIVEVGELFSTFATLGTRYGVKDDNSKLIEALMVKKISSVDNQLIFEQGPVEAQSVVSPQLAFLVHDVLQDEYARRKTLGYPNLLEIGRPSGAKNGANFNQNEIWTAGYTPQYTTVVWFGQKEPNSSALKSQVAGGVWYAIMQYLHRNEAVQTWSKPIGITEKEVCALSGLLPTRQCPEIVVEKFIDGTQPVNSDNLFRSYRINRETGLLATVFTPPELVEERTFMVVPDQALAWAQSAGVELPPKNYDAIQSPNFSEEVNISYPSIYSFVHGEIKVSGTASGDNFSSYRVQVGAGLNPQSWFEVNEMQNNPVNNGLLATWQTEALEDGLYALRLQVIRDNQQFETFTIQVSVDNTAPTVKLIYPAAGDNITLGPNKIITLHAQVEDSTGIARVEWWLDEHLIGTSELSPFSFPSKIAVGKHSLIVKAYDLAGNSTSTESLNFEVN